MPLDLTSAGAPGCFILAPWENQITVAVDAAGQSLIPSMIPNIPSIVDQHFYTQIVVVDLGANSLGWVTTNALDLEIGIP